MRIQSIANRRAALLASISMLSLAAGTAFAQSNNIGSVDVQTTGTGALPPLASPAAVGSKAPKGSAPALAPAQGSLDSFQPGSTVSDKVIRDIVVPSGDYNETVKYTPGFLSNNANSMGDSKGGWRGLADGQYNITFDGIPFGDMNDPSHHSGAYFPAGFLGSVVVDRGPGAASQAGYATFGGTLALRSIDLSDNFGGSIDNSYGRWNTMTNVLTVQSGLLGNSGVRSIFQYSHNHTDGAIQLGKSNQDQFLGKLEKDFGDFKVTVFSTYGQQQYNNINPITYPQLQQYGKRYGQVNSNPLSQQFYDYNNSQKQTDLEYIKVEGTWGNWHASNIIYTYSYWYPEYQNNGADQSIEGNASIANKGTVNKIGSVTIAGVANGDVTGYIKYNNYRAFGDIFSMDREIDAGVASGTVRTGVWWEHGSNNRLQEYIDYTTGRTFPSLGAPNSAAYKLQLNSQITNVQPFIEYNWRPIDGLTITPGYKFESFTRDHNAVVNQTTLTPLYYSHTYTTNLPFLAARYQVTPEATIYAQASQGFLAPTVSAYYVANPANNTIEPQTTTNLQAGAVYKTEKFTIDIDVYQITARNFPLVTTVNGLSTYQNAGKAQYQGLEAEGSYAVMKGLAIYGSAAAMSAKYIAGPFQNLRVGEAPNYTAVLGVVYDDGQFFGSALQKFTGDYYGSNGQKATSATTNGALNYVKGYNTLDLVVGARSSALHDWGFGQQVRVKLGIYNVFDHRNTTAIGGDPTGLTSINNTKLTYSFLPGRTIFGSVGIDF